MTARRFLIALCAVAGSLCLAAAGAALPAPLYIYTLAQRGDAATYDEAVAVATLQGIVNREAPALYVLSTKFPVSLADPARSSYWLRLLTREGEWLAGRSQVPVTDIDGLVRLTGAQLKGAIIWDPAVPATVNVATTLAGVHDAIVLSPELAARHLPQWKLPVLQDLRGKFTGQETGSAKNDAYRWAVREYLAKGLCSSRLLGLYHDAYFAREKGSVDYTVNRDWLVKNRAFAFDLSIWGDETPDDDRPQRLGLDLETYKLILAETRRLSAGEHLTELAGFFHFEKYTNYAGKHPSKHEPVPTEWETVWTISPFNIYQNTVTGDTYNQSLHSHAPRTPLVQRRTAKPHAFDPKKTYLCLFMADYDSAYVLYDFLPKHWDDPNRGKLPLAWGINPNLLETMPDLIAHFYRTLTPNDTITADAGAAGYINPSRIPEDQLPLFVRHNQAFFHEADLDLAPMVLDWVEPTAAVKDAFQQFSPAGYGAMVWDTRTNTGRDPEPHVWKNMPVLTLLNEANEFPGPEKTADIIAQSIAENRGGLSGFHFYRIVWQGPSQIVQMLDVLRRKHPEIDFEVLDIHTFFAMAREHLGHSSQALSITR
jgi:hypothetical protein